LPPSTIGGEAAPAARALEPGAMRRRQTVLWLTAALALALAAVATFVRRDAAADDSFYRAQPVQIIGAPGTLIRTERLELGLMLEADAYRILYRSTGLNGEPIAVSGAIFVPPGAAPQGSRNVIAWAHPTSGPARSSPR
jgi:hypothetical protein